MHIILILYTFLKIEVRLVLAAGPHTGRKHSVGRGIFLKAFGHHPGKPQMVQCPVGGSGEGFSAKAPSPASATTTEAAMRKAGYSQPPPGAEKDQPLGMCTLIAPAMTGMSSSATWRTKKSVSAY